MRDRQIDRGQETTGKQGQTEDTKSSAKEKDTVSVMLQTTTRIESFNAMMKYLEDKCNVDIEIEEVPDGDTGDQVIAAKFQQVKFRIFSAGRAQAIIRRVPMRKNLRTYQTWKI